MPSVFRRRAHGEFIHIGFTQRDCPDRLKLFDDRCVVGRSEVVQHVRASRGFHSLGAEYVFVSNWNTGKWRRFSLCPCRVQDSGTSHCLLCGMGNEGIELLIQLMNSIHVMRDQLFAGIFFTIERIQHLTD